MHCICVHVYVYVFIYLAGCSLSYRVKTLRSLLSSGDAGTAQAHKGRARIAQPDITRGHTGGASEVYPCAPPPPPVHLTRVETSNKSQSLQAPGSRAPADSPQKLAARRTQLRTTNRLGLVQFFWRARCIQLYRRGERSEKGTAFLLTSSA